MVASLAPITALLDGLAGVGRFGALHLAVLADLPSVELAALADPDRPLLDRLGQQFGVCRLYGDAQELIDNRTLEAIADRIQTVHRTLIHDIDLLL